MTSEKYQEDETRQNKTDASYLSWIFSGSYVNYYSLAPLGRGGVFVCVLCMFLVCLLLLLSLLFLLGGVRLFV